MTIHTYLIKLLNWNVIFSIFHFIFVYFLRSIILIGVFCFKSFPVQSFLKVCYFCIKLFVNKKRSQKIAFLNSFKHCSKQHVFSSFLSVISKKYLSTFLFKWRQKKLHNSVMTTNKNLYGTIQCYCFRTIFWRKKKER